MKRTHSLSRGREREASRCGLRPQVHGQGRCEGGHKISHKHPLILSFSRKEKGPLVLHREWDYVDGYLDDPLAE